MVSSEFYDNLINYQIESGINDRIFGLYKRICSLGLSSNAGILEIGCGIGSLTYLLSKKFTLANIEAVDFSVQSIGYAENNLKKKNVKFTAADIFDFEPQNLKFDCLLLFDVLEHIPPEKHIQLFRRISEWMDSKSILLINLPNPNHILFDRKNNPENLQEIDHPVFLNKLSETLDVADFNIEYFETYSVWVQDDFHFLIVKKKKAFVKNVLSQDRNFYQKLRVRLAREIRKFVYPYPVKKS